MSGSGGAPPGLTPSRSWRQLEDVVSDADPRTDAEVSQILMSELDPASSFRYQYETQRAGRGVGGVAAPGDTSLHDSWNSESAGPLPHADRHWDPGFGRGKASSSVDLRDVAEVNAMPSQHVPSPIRPRASSRGSDDGLSRVSSSPARSASGTDTHSGGKLYSSPLLVSDSLRTRFETPPRSESGLQQPALTMDNLLVSPMKAGYSSNSSVSSTHSRNSSRDSDVYDADASDGEPGDLQQMLLASKGLGIMSTATFPTWGPLAGEGSHKSTASRSHGNVLQGMRPGGGATAMHGEMPAYGSGGGRSHSLTFRGNGGHAGSREAEEYAYAAHGLTRSNSLTRRTPGPGSRLERSGLEGGDYPTGAHFLSGHGVGSHGGYPPHVVGHEGYYAGHVVGEEGGATTASFRGWDPMPSSLLFPGADVTSSAHSAQHPTSASASMQFSSPSSSDARLAQRHHHPRGGGLHQHLPPGSAHHHDEDHSDLDLNAITAENLTEQEALRDLQEDERFFGGDGDAGALGSAALYDHSMASSHGAGISVDVSGSYSGTQYGPEAGGYAPGSSAQWWQTLSPSLPRTPMEAPQKYARYAPDAGTALHAMRHAPVAPEMGSDPLQLRSPARGERYEGTYSTPNVKEDPRHAHVAHHGLYSSSAEESTPASSMKHILQGLDSMVDYKTPSPGKSAGMHFQGGYPPHMPQLEFPRASSMAAQHTWHDEGGMGGTAEQLRHSYPPRSVGDVGVAGGPAGMPYYSVGATGGHPGIIPPASMAMDASGRPLYAGSVAPGQVHPSSGYADAGAPNYGQHGSGIPVYHRSGRTVAGMAAGAAAGSGGNARVVAVKPPPHASVDALAAQMHDLRMHGSAGYPQPLPPPPAPYGRGGYVAHQAAPGGSFYGVAPSGPAPAMSRSVPEPVHGGGQHPTFGQRTSASAGYPSRGGRFPPGSITQQGPPQHGFAPPYSTRAGSDFSAGSGNTSGTGSVGSGNTMPTRPPHHGGSRSVDTSIDRRVDYAHPARGPKHEPGPVPVRPHSAPEQQGSHHNLTPQDHFPMPVDGSRGSDSLPVSRKHSDTDDESVRAGLTESPVTRSLYKSFYKQFRSLDRCYLDAKYFVQTHLQNLPAKVHWKVMLELADLAKRENRFAEARRIYRDVTRMQPYAAQGWMEFSKMEEECGRLNRCRAILRQGLTFCKHNENLLSKSIKLEERFNDLDTARSLLSQLQHVSLDKCWRTLLEGALLEARASNVGTARKVFRYLMEIVPWYGPIYQEALKFEERQGNLRKALAIVNRGVESIPKYGPLWFGAFRLLEKYEAKRSQNISTAGRLVLPSFLLTRAVFDQAVLSISRELVWKVYFEAARLEERALELCDILLDEVLSRDSRGGGGGGGGLSSPRHSGAPGSPGNESAFGGKSPRDSPSHVLAVLPVVVPGVHRVPPLALAAEDNVVAEREMCIKRFRDNYIASASTCPDNLRWKVWLSGARSELCAGNDHIARTLIARADAEVPYKSKAQVMLELARLEEYSNNIDDARKLLADARAHSRQDWKVFLESVLLERRVGCREAAEKLALEALELHPGTGRLWAILVQLRAVGGPVDQMSVFSHALTYVPKSGEVWAEGARLYMNPCSPYYDTVEAGRCLLFGLQFTPQYGDSFIEWLRLCLLVAAGYGTHDESQLQDEAVRIATMCSVKSFAPSLPCFFRTLEESLDVNLQDTLSKIDVSAVEQRCINADPNYGSMWFHCKVRPFDTARHVLRRAKAILSCEINLCRMKYATAAMRGRTKRLKAKMGPTPKSPGSSGAGAVSGVSTSVTVDSTDISEEEGVTDLLDAEEATMMAAATHDSPGTPHLTPRHRSKSNTVITTTHADYATGFVSLNRQGVEEPASEKAKDRVQRRRMLFGSDLILP